MPDEKLGLAEMFCVSSFVVTNKTRFMKGILVVDDVEVIDHEGSKLIVIRAHDKHADIEAVYSADGKRVSSERTKRDRTITKFNAEKEGILRTFSAEEGDGGVTWLRTTGEGAAIPGQKVFGTLPKATIDQMLRAYAKHLGFAPIVEKKEIVVASVTPKEE